MSENENQAVVLYQAEAIEKIVKTEGLPSEEGLSIREAYAPFFKQYSEIIAQTQKINFLSPEKLDEEIASKLRKALVKIRTGSKEVKDGRKKIHLLRGNVEQNVWKLIEADCLLKEEELEQVEKRREIAEAARKDALEESRKSQLSTYAIDMTGFNFREMTDETFQMLLQNTKAAHDAKIEAARKAEEERIREEAERVERERALAAENARLKAEQEKADREAEAARVEAKRIQDELEAKAKADREEADAKLKAERAEKARLQKQIDDQKALDDAIEAKRIEDDRKAASAPDKEKLVQLALSISSITIPELSTEEGKKIAADVLVLLGKTTKFIHENTEKL